MNMKGNRNVLGILVALKKSSLNELKHLELHQWACVLLLLPVGYVLIHAELLTEHVV